MFRLTAGTAALALSMFSLPLVVPGLLTSAKADPAPTATAFTQTNTNQATPTTGTSTTAGAAVDYSGTVPAGVCSVTVNALGASGGHNMIGNNVSAAAANGAGARVIATFQVVPGQTYSGQIGSGGARQQGGGNPGGGTGGDGSGHEGAGGGGLTSVQIGGQDVVVAGGGGASGGGHSTTEGYGGNAGQPTGVGVTAGAAGQGGRDANGSSQPIGTGPTGGGGGGTAGPGSAGQGTQDAADGTAGSGRTGGNGGPDANLDTGGGGGAGYYGGGGGGSTINNGQGAPVAGGPTGAGGGGGSSYVRPASPDGSGATPTDISSGLNIRSNAAGPGANGSVSLTWGMCSYDLGVTKSVSPTAAEVGDTVTWTVAVTNNGPDPMSLGDTVTLGDTQTTGTTIASLGVSGGSNTRGLARGAVTCNAAVGQPMPATLTCSRPFSAPDAPTAPSTGVRGLDSGETLTITYTKTLAAGDVGTINNVATVTDRGATANNTATAGLTVSLPQPTANPDTSTGTQGAPQSVNPLTNDTPGSASAGSQFDPTTLTLLDGTTPVASLVIPNQGTYTIDRTDPANPRLVFTPLPTYFGTATPANYRITDRNNQSASSTYTPTVTQVARPDTATGPQGVPLSTNVLANDIAPGVTLVPSTLTLIGSNGQPATSVTVAGGVYSIANGQVVFTPDPTFLGTAPPVTYQVNDSDGNPIRSTYTPTITPVTPSAGDDESSGPQGAPQSVGPFANDAPGNDNVPLNKASLTLLDGDGDPVATLTIANQGTYSVDRTDPANPRLVFQPLPTYTGTPTPVDYRVADANGTFATASYQPVVEPVTRPDTSTGIQGAQQTRNVLANDTRSTPAGGGFDPTTLQLVDPADGVAKDSVTVPNVGTYTVDDSGNVIFQPLPGYVGTPDPLTYRVRDLDGNLLADTYTPTVTRVTPVAVPDETTGPQGVAQSVAPLANDRPGNPAVPLDPASLTLLDGTTPVDTLLVPGQGTYTIDRRTPASPRIVFTPLANFTGDATPATYRVADANGTTATTTYTPSFAAVTPTGKPDFTTSTQGDLQSVDPFADNGADADEPGDPAVPIVRSTLTFVNAAGNPIADTLTIPGEGTYRINRTDPDNPRIEFQPLPDYVGTPTPVSYRFRDANLTLSDAVTYNPTVLPVTQPDTSTGLQGRPQTVNVLTNDNLNPPAGGGFDTSTLQLIDPADNTAKDSVTVPNVGTYTVDDAGNITFQPLPQYVGTPPALTYQVRDNDGNLLSDVYTPTVDRVTPTATPDTTRGPQGVAQSVNPLTNDDPGDPSVPLDPDSLTLLDGTTPVAELEVPGQGTYTVAGGRLVFTPLPSFVGTATPATYRVADVNGTTTTSTYTPTLLAVTPVARPDASSGPQGALQRVDPFADNGNGADTPGNAAVPLNRSSLTLLNGAGNPVETLDVAGQGTYAIDRTDPDNPTITFQPLPTFTGQADPVDYRIADANGTQARTTYTPTVTPVTRPDTSSDVQGVAQTVNVLANDTRSTPGGGGFDPTTLQLIDPADGVAKDSVTVPNVGTYTVDNAGNVTFQPLPSFIGTADPISYQVRDRSGGTLQDTYTPTVTAIAPTANPDTTSGPQGLPQRVNPLVGNANGGADVPGDPRVPLDPASLVLLDADGNVATSVAVDGQGTYTIDRSAAGGPYIVFTPLPTFSGTATPVDYRVADVNGTTARSTYTPTVSPVVPAASPDTTSGPQGRPQRVSPLANDTPGNAAVPLDPSTFTLLDADGDPATSVTVTGQGTYTVDDSDPDNPVIVFTPLPGFTGTATPVSYRVLDDNGTAAQSTYTPTVTPVAPRPAPDATSGPLNRPQSIDPLANDRPGDAAVPLDPSSLTLLNADGDPVTSVTIDGEGTYTIANGRIVFTPVTGFFGQATPVTYRIADVNGTTATSTYTPTIIPPDVEVVNVSNSGQVGDPVTVNPLDENPDIDPGTIRLVGPDGQLVTTLVVPGEGTWVVNPRTGAVTFTPEDGFTGDPTPVDYVALENDGTPVVGTLTITYEEPDDTGTGPDLADTGAQAGLLGAGLLSLALIAGGVTLVVYRRRRDKISS